MSTIRYLLIQVEVGDPTEPEGPPPTTQDWAEYSQLRAQIEKLESWRQRARVSAAFELTDDGLRYQRQLLVRNAGH